MAWHIGKLGPIVGLVNISFGNIPLERWDSQEVYVVEHLLGLSVLSAKDDHEHGVFWLFALVYCLVGWAQQGLE